MATGHDAHDDTHGHDDDHGHGAHDDHGHDAHGSGGDAWVVPPLVIGAVIGLVVAVVLGLGSGVSPF